ncbi:MAG: methyl-accepting chemotaxis protein, partial [Chthoniobacterales bacterium]|nr:methyl-accepting chemotaxis protein [Chthoniobacterales bacterium]
KEFFEVNREVGLIAYARPVILTESCMSCHGDPSLSPSGDGRDILGFKMEGWKPGERRGVYLLTAPVSKIDTPTREGILASLMWILPIGVGIILVALFVANKISFRLNETIWLLAESSKQLTDSSVQIAQSSSTIAEGASEQASSLEQTSASLEEIASMTKRNAENAQSAREVSRQAREAAEMGAMSVVEMNRAMADIQAASDNISKIIKTIDEIAFQTNILALNAAVEAARAGEAGMGFAVVADEVRALAQRSAEAARETAERIEDSVRKASSGVTISDKVAKNLDEIVQKIRVVDEFVAEIAAASREQSQGIEQVNVAVNEMDKVVQKNASYSEEFSAAAENLKQQAALLKDTILRLRQLATGS